MILTYVNHLFRVNKLDYQLKKQGPNSSVCIGSLHPLNPTAPASCQWRVLRIDAAMVLHTRRHVYLRLRNFSRPSSVVNSQRVPLAVVERHAAARVWAAASWPPSHTALAPRRSRRSTAFRCCSRRVERSGRSTSISPAESLLLVSSLS